MATAKTYIQHLLRHRVNPHLWFSSHSCLKAADWDTWPTASEIFRAVHSNSLLLFDLMQMCKEQMVIKPHPSILPLFFCPLGFVLSFVHRHGSFLEVTWKDYFYYARRPPSVAVYGQIIIVSWESGKAKEREILRENSEVFKKKARILVEVYPPSLDHWSVSFVNDGEWMTTTAS